MIDIRTSYKDGAVWYTPYERFWIFWWIELDFISTDINEIKKYLDKKGL